MIFNLLCSINCSINFYENLINYKIILQNKTEIYVIEKAIISNQYTLHDLSVSVDIAIPSGISEATIGKYIYCQRQIKHHIIDVTADAVADIVCTLLSILNARKLGAAPTKQIKAQVRKARNVRCTRQSPKLFATSIHAGMSNNAIVNMNTVKTQRHLVGSE